ncbi:hypothetical protein PI125_g9549 [Phytophthora idaei]|nr:hypothetical protein PI125_g9549 [Phytophthora idaei]
MVVALHPDGLPREVSLPAPLHLQPVGQYGRCLGIHVGCRRDSERTAEVAEKQLVTRLHMACCKTLMEVKNFIWHGCFALDLPQMRAWIGADLAALPRTSGGMAVPDLRTELMAMTGSTVASSTSTSGAVPAVYLTPRDSTDTSGVIRRHETMW